VLGVDPVWGMLIAVAGASVPDLDQNWAPRDYVPRPGSKCRLLEHRSFTHAPVTAVALGWLVGAGTAWWVGAVFCVGWLSHLAADSISYMGVPWLWPLTARRIRLLPYGFRVRSGNRLFELPVSVAVLVLGFYLSGVSQGWLAALH
jgi:membrane-bound metal-dependent hydrolase YbcI (DUF457 family)